MGSISPPSEDKPWTRTPLVESAALSRAAGCRIFLKLDLLQPSGSFKSRGIGNLILHHIRSHPPGTRLHFFSSSGGNAGLACVISARKLGYPASVVVPLSTKPAMIAKIRAAGATEVMQVGATWADADRHLREVVLKEAETHGIKGMYVPPFDHPQIWEGNGTIVDEIAEQLPGKPDAIICAVGGGGLFCGIMHGLEKHDWLDGVQVLAVETKGTDSLAQSLVAGNLVTLSEITSLAKSLGATRVADQTFCYGQRPTVTSVVVSDKTAAIACLRFADDEKLLVELAGGAGAALCYDKVRLQKLIKGFDENSKIVLEVCGGSSVSLKTLEDLREMFGTTA